MAEIPFTVAGPENLVLDPDDVAIVDNLAFFNSTDSITGAAGVQNALVVIADAPLSLVTGPAAFNGIQGIEAISLESSFAHVVVLDNSFLANNSLQGVLTISAFVGAAPITVDASALSSSNAVSFDGDAGNDTLRGGAGSDTFFGFDGNDSAVGGGGADFLIGDRGDDILLGGADDDLLAGEGGNDTLDGGAGDDIASYAFAAGAVVVDLGSGAADDGEGGIDVLISIELVEGSDFGDLLIGSADDDLIRGLGGDDSIDGGDGFDFAVYDTEESPVTASLQLGVALVGEESVDLLFSIEGIAGSDQFGDLLFGSLSGDDLQGNGGGDALIGFDGDDTLRGGEEGDSLFGDAPGAGADSIEGGNGNDSIFAGAGNDSVDSGDDSDLISGEEGNDTLSAGPGQDLVLGGGGSDQIQTADGDDTIYGGGGADALAGGNGNDRINAAGDDVSAAGGDGVADVLVIGANASGLRQIDLGAAANQNVTGSGPTITGFEAVDASTASAGVTVTGAEFGATGNVLIGGAQADSISGSTAADVIMGGGGADTLSAGLGNDTVFGDQGNDTMTGGGGADVFFYSGGTGAGAVRIADFAAGADKIGLPVALGLTAAQADSQLVASGSDSLLQIAAGQSITFVGVSPAAISANDFLVF